MCPSLIPWITRILKNINFTIPAGSTFAILGTTGSGKSTLVHLLNRLYDLPEGCGSITIGGTDIRDIDRQYLRQNIGMVLQEPFLFSRPSGKTSASQRSSFWMRKSAMQRKLPVWTSPSCILPTDTTPLWESAASPYQAVRSSEWQLPAC